MARELSERMEQAARLMGEETAHRFSALFPAVRMDGYEVAVLGHMIADAVCGALESGNT